MHRNIFTDQKILAKIYIDKVFKEAEPGSPGRKIVLATAKMQRTPVRWGGGGGQSPQ